jgi:hypothetical protein
MAEEPAFPIRPPHSPGRCFCISLATLCSSLEDRHTTIVGASFARSVAALFPLVAEQLATRPSWRHHGRTTWRSREFDLAAVSTYMDHYVHRSSPDQQDWSAVVKDCQCPTIGTGISTINRTGRGRLIFRLHGLSRGYGYPTITVLLDLPMCIPLVGRTMILVGWSGRWRPVQR